MQEKRYFTLEEANACIPELVDEISQLRAIRNLLAGLHAEITPLLEVVSSNGGSKHTPALLKATADFEEILERIAARGCHLKGLDPGLVDFPHLREGREVYLCWRINENKIRYWHEIEDGFEGRQRL
ncbi:DUF2203 family protein [Candidatus Poribacteria bacterium]|nr:DUF2203 family protein [Candidatus Poribacteria bacterium]MYG08008.1 DUF2203 family protein [Candidatus Poribacteria bacterium]MYK21382.1 DUF2203 family protein [Candidatus Poribacteria bacterium]